MHVYPNLVSDFQSPKPRERERESACVNQSMSAMADEGEIVVHAIKSGESREGGRKYSYGELYRVNLRTGLVCKYPSGRLLLDDYYSSMAVIGDVIYILGGLEYLEGQQGLIRKDGDGVHCMASCIDFDKKGCKWQSIPHYQSVYRSRRQCVSFKGRLFLFGGYINVDTNAKRSPGEVFDPKNGKWDFLPTPPYWNLTLTQTLGSHVSTPVLVDHSKNRIIVHSRRSDSLFAYYPDASNWENLLPPKRSFRTWTKLVALVDGMLIFYDVEVPTYFFVFDLEAKEFLTPSFKPDSDVDTLLCQCYEALLALKPTSAFCLASGFEIDNNSNPNVPLLKFVKFRVERTPSREALFTFISFNAYDMDSICYVTSFVHTVTGDDQTGAASITNIMDTKSPYYLHRLDHPGLVFATQPLLNEDGNNYFAWKSNFLNALELKNKAGFVDGSIENPGDKSPYHQAWIQCNAVVKSWLMNALSKELQADITHMGTAREIWADFEERFSHGIGVRVYELKRSIALLQQEKKRSVSTYYGKLKGIWSELLNLKPIPICSCGAGQKLQEEEKVFDFLMGLDDSYKTVRSHILSIEPLPGIDKAYAMVAQDEKQNRNVPKWVQQT